MGSYRKLNEIIISDITYEKFMINITIDLHHTYFTNSFKELPKKITVIICSICSTNL